MKVTIDVDGLERTYRGDYDCMHTSNWNELVRDMIDASNDMEKMPPEEYPFIEQISKETQDALDKLTIRK